MREALELKAHHTALWSAHETVAVQVKSELALDHVEDPDEDACLVGAYFDSNLILCHTVFYLKFIGVKHDNLPLA